MKLWLEGKTIWSRAIPESSEEQDEWRRLDHHEKCDGIPDFDDDQEFSSINPKLIGIKSDDMFPAIVRADKTRHLVVAVAQDNPEEPFCFQDQEGKKYSKRVLYLGDKIDPKTFEPNWDSVLKQFQGPHGKNCKCGWKIKGHDAGWLEIDGRVFYNPFIVYGGRSGKGFLSDAISKVSKDIIKSMKVPEEILKGKHFDMNEFLSRHLTKPKSGTAAKGLVASPDIYFTSNSVWYEFVGKLADLERALGKVEGHDFEIIRSSYPDGERFEIEASLWGKET